MLPQRIQRKRTKGFKLPLNTVCVNRPTKWGNPFIPGKYLNGWGMAFIAIQLCKQNPKEIRKIYKSGVLDKKITIKTALKYYKLWVNFMVKEGKLNTEELRGKNLACFCPLSSPCHVDILLKLANK